MARRSLLVAASLLGAVGVLALTLAHRQSPAPGSMERPDAFVERPAATAVNPDAGEGATAAGDGERVGRRDPALSKAKGNTVVMQAAEAEPPAGVAEDAGVLGALRGEGASGDGELADGIGGLLGAKGTQLGGSGLATRGTGLGGGGTAEGLGGLGTKGSGYGAGSGNFASKGDRGSGLRAVRPPALDVTARPNHGVEGREEYTDHGVHAMQLAAEDRLSTFSIDVDTGSYTLARSSLDGGRLPAAASVRVEEFVNYFDYDYVGPNNGAPFAVNMEAAPHPWIEGHHLLRVGVQGATVDDRDRRPARLVFLVDVSGSMGGPGRLDLARQALSHLVEQLGPEDSVGIVTYAGSVQRVLEPTACTDKARILAAIDTLRPGGSTAMGSGIELAYQMARDGYVRGAENRVVVLSDGDANVGPTSHEQILEQIRGYAREGITLSTVGFGRGNYRDTLMEQLADEGDGNYSYVDSLDEGRRVFGQRLAGTIQTIARDVKIQVELNPEAVLAWRLVGYENRDIADHDFRNDQVDAGEIGSGHSVTALYDVILRDGHADRELATVRLRAKPPGPDAPAQEWLTTFQPRLLRAELADTSPSFRLALGAATFAELLRGSPYTEEVTYGQVWDLVSGASRGRKEEQELLALVAQAARLTGEEGFVAMR